MTPFQWWAVSWTLVALFFAGLHRFDVWDRTRKKP